jgi:hypothetical protein
MANRVVEVGTSPEVVQLAEALGLNPRNVVGFNLRVRHNDVVRVTAHLIPDRAEIRRLGKVVPEIMVGTFTRPRPKAKIQLRPGVPVSDEMRDHMNAWLAQTFGCH